MLRLRAICPNGRSEAVLDVLRNEPGAAHLAVFRDASLRPPGDVVEAELARESTDRVLDRLDELGLERDGAIGLENVDTLLSDTADAAEDAVPGEGADAVVWSELIERTGEESQLNGIFLAFLTIACLLAAVGILTNSAITLVGAMVVGPEFGPLAALATALAGRQWKLARKAGVALAVGFPFAMFVTAVLALLARAVGLLDSGALTEVSEISFIYHVGPFSVIVALLAGAAGMLALTSAKSSALVGVFISVTTVPAAGFAVIAAVEGNWPRCAASLAQLGVNLVGMTVAGILVLLVRRARNPPSAPR